MVKDILVEVGRFRIATNPTRLKCIGLGSCLGIVLHDPKTQIGGMAHTMLPRYEEGRYRHNPVKYVDTAIYIMVDEMIRLGVRKDRITAKLAGGAQMFSYLGPGVMNIGERNVDIAIEILKKEGIQLSRKDVGGDCGRTVIFDTVSGDVLVRTTNGGETKI